jgi:hypothetical protein
MRRRAFLAAVPCWSTVAWAQGVADLPIEQGMRTHLIVNQHTAKLLGVSLPTVLLARADEVID